MQNNNLTFIGDIVEENGKTIKQNNLEKKHNIPIGSLIEINNNSGLSDEQDEEQIVVGLRLWVVSHDRDCNGAPLYTLSFNKKQKNYI